MNEPDDVAARVERMRRSCDDLAAAVRRAVDRERELTNNSEPAPDGVAEPLRNTEPTTTVPATPACPTCPECGSTDLVPTLPRERTLQWFRCRACHHVTCWCADVTQDAG